LFSPRSTLRSQRAIPSRARRGFALLITITLLAFLVILLVGLATYTRVETAVAGNTQRQAQARQNALVGLNLAVAQLQKYAGPDTRVTATAESFPSVNSQKRRYTGVWHSDPAATADPTTPLAWLVSGLETGATVDVTQAIPAASRVALTGPKTDGSTFLANGNPGANNVVAPLQSITAPGVPGVNGTPVIGRYAWWVGDQGVKAPVAVPDASASVAYAPWDTADARLRLRQQIPLGAGAVSTTGAPVFEPRDAASSPLVSANRVVATSQLAFLKTASPTGAAVTTAASAIGLTPVQQNFHNWSPNNYAVLASTAPASAGLRRDLSLDPSLLGAGFAAWADYKSYMEPPVPAVAASDPSVVRSESVV
jgi:Tfp pilus assembly protein PilX